MHRAPRIVQCHHSLPIIRCFPAAWRWLPSLAMAPGICGPWSRRAASAQQKSCGRSFALLEHLRYGIHVTCSKTFQTLPNFCSEDCAQAVARPCCQQFRNSLLPFAIGGWDRLSPEEIRPRFRRVRIFFPPTQPPGPPRTDTDTRRPGQPRQFGRKAPQSKRQASEGSAQGAGRRR